VLGGILARGVLERLNYGIAAVTAIDIVAIVILLAVVAESLIGKR
jgi:hypothetical protein